MITSTLSKLVARLGNRTGKAGFTMIELLIVIAILGILAVAVLSAINPVEQINRGRDTGARSDAEQLLSAIDRFNAFQGYVPWRTGPNDGATNDAVAWTELNAAAALIDSGGTCHVLEKLSTAAPGGGVDTCTVHADELKLTFITRIIDSTYNHMFIYNNGGTGESTYVCFAPQSQAFATEALNRLDTDGDGTADSVPADYPSEAYDPALGGTSVAADCGPDLNCVCLP